MENETVSKNFIENIIDKDLAEGVYDTVHTRFPPEPNGYLHIGHAKSILLNYGLAQEYNGKFNMRFDDTNPTKEKSEFVESIKADIKWLGADWEDRLFFASDYFEQMYEAAVKLIQKGKAYVCDLTADQIREYRGTLTEPGKESPYRNRSVEENLQLFEEMKEGKYADGEKVLRAKIDMASPNMNMRDPVIYRVAHMTHHRTGDTWCIYPMYDFAHPIEDAIEGITHSICTLEFEDHRPLYDWVDNYPEGEVEYLEAPNNMENEKLGTRKIPFGRELYIEREDFMVDPPKKYKRMFPGTEVRLMNAYFVTCTGYEADEDGTVRVVHCTYDPATKGGNAPDGRKVKGTIHWVEASQAGKAEVRLYENIVDEEKGVYNKEDGSLNVNPNSLTKVTAYVEPALMEAKGYDSFQFVRTGFFCADIHDSKEGAPVFNRIVSLKSSFKLPKA